MHRRYKQIVSRRSCSCTVHLNRNVTTSLDPMLRSTRGLREVVGCRAGASSGWTRKLLPVASSTFASWRLVPRRPKKMVDYQAEITGFASLQLNMLCYYGTLVGLPPNLVSANCSSATVENQCSLHIRSQSSCDEDLSQTLVPNTPDAWKWSRYYW